MAGSGNAHLRPDADDSVLVVDGLEVTFGGRRDPVYAVSGVSLDIVDGETLGLVGESGCGKSTLGRAIAQLIRPTAGKVDLGGVELTELKGSALRSQRRRLQMVFQDPISSLNPRRRVGDIVAEPLDIWGFEGDRDAKVGELLEAVGLDPAVADRRPYEFSGGQAQRISIARALAIDPAMLICDEPVSALDVSVQAQILNLMEDLKQRFSLTMIFIAHDLAVVKHVSDRIAVMYLGKLCEVGEPDVLYHQPAHPYTAALISAIPHVSPIDEPDVPPLEGDLPSPHDPPSGCRFRTRCPKATEVCTTTEPIMRPVDRERDHHVACHHPLVDVPVDLVDNTGSLTNP